MPSIGPRRYFAAGFHDFMIQFGGDMYVAGRRDDRPWRLGIRDPRGPADRICFTGPVGRHVQHLG